MKSLKNKKYIWKDLKKSRKASILMGFIFISANIILSSLSVLLFFSIQSFLLNTNIPSSPPRYNFIFSDLKEMYVKVPYNISNNGIFPINQITINITVDFLYVENITFKETRETIFSKEGYISNSPYCSPGEKLIGIFEGDYSYFNLNSIGTYLNEVDKTSNIKKFMNIEVSGYLNGIIFIFVRLEDIDLEKYGVDECNCA